MTNEFDFGFTAVTEDELSSVETSKRIVEETQASKDELQSRLHELYSAVIPLLDNLRKDPEKPFILWPDRVDKIDAFESKLTEILNRD